MKSLKIAAAATLAIITLVGSSVAQTASAQDKMIADQKMMSSCMAMSHDAMMKDAGCMAMMKTMKMSDDDMMKMKGCMAMSRAMMMKDEKCKAMMKMHPDMMKAPMAK